MKPKLQTTQGRRDCHVNLTKAMKKVRKAEDENGEKEVKRIQDEVNGRLAEEAEHNWCP